jgi:NADPH-dependent 2,4-dienoyl-CoA reductase/sulfur reductase-like enzyme
MRRLAAAVADGRKDVAVVGGGLVGVESALTFAGAGHQVTVIDLLARPLDRLHDPIPALAASFLAEAGVAFVGGAALEEVVAGPDGLVTVCYKGGSVAAEVVVAATGGRVVAPPGVGPERTLPLEVGPDMALPGLEHVYAIGDLVVAPHARFGPIRFPQWDGAIGTGEQAADAIAGVAGSYVRLPYWWSDLGTHRLAEVGWAGAVVEWRDEDGLHVGQDDDGGVAAVLVVDEPRRVREARTLVQDAG